MRCKPQCRRSQRANPEVVGADILRHIFERIVWPATAVGLIKRKDFAVHASVLEANASRYHGKAPEEFDWTDAQPTEAEVAIKVGRHDRASCDTGRVASEDRCHAQWGGDRTSCSCLVMACPFRLVLHDRQPPISHRTHRPALRHRLPAGDDGRRRSCAQCAGSRR